LGRRHVFRNLNQVIQLRIASEVLDGSFRTALSGESKEFRESSSSLMFAMIDTVHLVQTIADRVSFIQSTGNRR